ncbi:MAG: hypothetical protein M3Q49_15390 [Actinomycetota bacterium]|nr:hypothetical protein [Actinomycetota bacterium]
MGRLLFAEGTFATAESSYGADVLVEDEKVAAVGERGSGRFVGSGFMAAEELEVPV